MKRFAIPLILLLIVADIHCQVELSPKARKAWNVTIPDEKQDKDFDYNQDASIIHRRIKDGNSLAAFRQLKNAIGNNKPENADFGIKILMHTRISVVCNGQMFMVNLLVGSLTFSD